MVDERSRFGRTPVHRHCYGFTAVFGAVARRAVRPLPVPAAAAPWTPSAAPAGARWPDRLTGHRVADGHGRGPGPTVQAVHQAEPHLRAHLQHGHGNHAVRRDQRLSVHQGRAHHQRVQVRWTSKLFQIQRAVRWRSE